MAGATTFKVAAIFTAFDKMSRPMHSINKTLGRYQKNMLVSQSITRRSSLGMMGSFKGLATGIVGASVAYTIFDKAILGTIRRGAELENTLVQAGAKFGKSAGVVQGTKKFKMMEAAVLRTGLTTEFSANQSAEALKVLAQAGLEVNQSIATLPLVADFATASGLELARATSISADAIGALGGNIKDLSPSELKKKMSEVNDLMVITANTYNTSVEEMFSATTKGGRVLTTLIGASGFQFAAFVGEAANAGLKAEVAGTGIRAAFLRMVSGVPEAKKAMRTLGVRMTDNNGKMLDAITILAQIRKGLSGVKNEAKKAAFMQKLFGRVGINVMSTLLGRSEVQLRKTTAAMEAQRGEVKRIAALIRATLLGKWIKFISLMEGLGLIIFKKVKPGLKLIVSGLTFVASAVAKSSQPLIILIGLMIKVASLFGVVRLAIVLFNFAIRRSPIFFLINALLILTTIFPNAASAILKYADIIFILTTAIWLVRTALIAWAAMQKSITAILILGKIQVIALAIWQGVLTTATWLATAATAAFGVVMAIVTSPITLVILAIVALVAGIVWMINNFQKVKDFFSGVWMSASILMKPFTMFISMLKNFLPNAIKNIALKTKNIFTGIWDGVTGFLGFGDEEKNIDVNKTTDVNFQSKGGEIAASPMAQAVAKIQGKLDIEFHNKPDEVSVSKSFENGIPIKLSSSGN